MPSTSDRTRSRAVPSGGNAAKTRKTTRKTKKGGATARAGKAAAKTNGAAKPSRPYAVRRSPIHGRGVFATRTIRKGADIIEYRGERISMKEADRRPPSDPGNPYHTFLFELDDGRVIDASVRGNAARWINHSCAGNCEPYEDEEGRVYIAAKRTIRKGEELAYDYRLNVPGRITRSVLEAYACRCGAPRCRGTMLGRKKAG
jgi:SET domain-containing protein